jgi:putative addiction module component (TIGR02574 family)
VSKQQILDELPKLPPEERRQILERLGDLEDRDLAEGKGITAEEAALLDRELAEFQNDPNAGSRWEDVERRLMRRGQ